MHLCSGRHAMVSVLPRSGPKTRAFHFGASRTPVRRRARMMTVSGEVRPVSGTSVCAVRMPPCRVEKRAHPPGMMRRFLSRLLEYLGRRAELRRWRAQEAILSAMAAARGKDAVLTDELEREMATAFMGHRGVGALSRSSRWNILTRAAPQPARTHADHVPAFGDDAARGIRNQGAPNAPFRDPPPTGCGRPPLAHDRPCT